MSTAEKGQEQKLSEIAESLLDPPLDASELVPLLDKAEKLLLKVEQSPSESMSAALHPVMKGLISKELLGHPDADVRHYLTACISEITRITAPDAPYDDELMKEIFQMIVKAFENLNDVSSHLYLKRVSILETVAKVRSCILMLDLDCDLLILDMFRHFLRTIRDNHSGNVFSAMEVIMTLVLEESDDITTQLFSLLLTSLKKDRTDILPVARKLAEKVITNCSHKLKPCLMKVVQSLGAPLSDYGSVIVSVCQENSRSSERNRLDASADCLADDSRFSERTVSDELAQGSGKMESEVSCPEVATASMRSPKSVMSNGNTQKDTKLTNKKKSQTIDFDRSKSEYPPKKRGRKPRLDVSDDTPITELVSKIKKQKDKKPEDENVKSTPVRKRSRDEGSVTPGHEEKLEYDESAVGRKIKVWWPDDAKFYPGVIVGYNPTTKKHKVSYADGDKETLMLKNERFEFIGASKKSEESSSTPQTASNTSEKKKRRDDNTPASGNGGRSGVKPGRKPTEISSQSKSNSRKKKVISESEKVQE